MELIEGWLVALWRQYIRGLCTSSEHVGTVQRRVRCAFLVVPYFVVAWLLFLRSKARGPLLVEAATSDGIRLRCRLPDLIPMYVYLFGAWEPDLAAFLRRRLRPGDTFVDVGANVGCFTALAGKLVGPSGTVVAIEPSPPVNAVLAETVTINGLGNVRIVEAALSDRHHDLPLFAGPANNVGMTTTVAHHGFRELGRVPAAPLGSFVTEDELASTRVIKIDVEGAEDRILAGMVAHFDELAADAEVVVELSPTWWSDLQLRPIDVLRPYLDRGFHVYALPNDYWPWRYLWPRDIEAPHRLRDLDVLERRVERLDLVLSRTDADVL